MIRLVPSTTPAPLDDDGYLTDDWMLALGRRVETIASGMGLDDPERNRVGTLAGILVSGATARDRYPIGMSRLIDVVERRRSLDASREADRALREIGAVALPDPGRAAAYAVARGWPDVQ